MDIDITKLHLFGSENPVLKDQVKKSTEHKGQVIKNMEHKYLFTARELAIICHTFLCMPEEFKLLLSLPITKIATLPDSQEELNKELDTLMDIVFPAIGLPSITQLLGEKPKESDEKK